MQCRGWQSRFGITSFRRMSDFDPDSLRLEETDARYIDEMELVQFDARIRHQRVTIDVSAEAIEDLVGEAPLSPERLVDGAEAHRTTLAQIARRKVAGRMPAGGIVLLTARDIPRRSAPSSSSIH